MICKFQKAKNEMLHPSCETRILVEAEMPVSPSFEGNASQLCNRPDHPALSGKPSIKLHSPPPLLINDCENISFSHLLTPLDNHFLLWTGPFLPRVSSGGRSHFVPWEVIPSEEGLGGVAAPPSNTFAYPSILPSCLKYICLTHRLILHRESPSLRTLSILHL